MTTNPPPRRVRLVARAGWTVGGLVLLTAHPAAAVPPEGWPVAQPVSALHVLLLLVGGPLALAAVITLAVYLPSMARGGRYTPGLAWRNQNEWFGGPRGGVEASDQVDQLELEAGPRRDQGGASARW